jgi:formylglycine-generating enzyme required for sulfatase activity
MLHHAFPKGVTRDALIEWYRANRARTRELFDFLTPDAYYDRPIALRNPIVFYEGHLPAFSVNTLAKLALKKRGVDERFETLFARGIDPEDEASAKSPTDVWPSREEVQRFADACDALVIDILRNETLEDEAVPELRGGEAVLTILEHEQMHQETLLYMLHQVPFEKKLASGFGRLGIQPKHSGSPKPDATPIAIPAGIATLGASGSFGWDNEFPAHSLHVPAFDIDVYDVTNGDYLDYMHATGASAPHFWIRGENEWSWRGMFAAQPLNLDAPVYVTHAEAVAYARWKKRALPTEAQWHRAAEGADEGHYDFVSLDPTTVGQYKPSKWGVHDLVGNGWEWTSTIFAGFPGFRPMPSYSLYSADFFDDAHYVLKGASPVTARQLVRPSFRNWFRPHYPYVYATFRTVNEPA